MKRITSTLISHFQNRVLKAIVRSRILNLIILLNTLFASSYAQTFPAPGSCTSKDLELVDATLPGDNICNSCTPGTLVTRTLNISINNKTGSTRTAFAFWGRLEIYNDDGTLDSTHSGLRSACVGTIPKNTITNFATSVTVTFSCGQSLRLTNLYLAWTDAAPSSTCPTLLNNTSTINPKCGTLPLVQINAGVNAVITVVNTTCTSNGSMTVSPFGGKSPYTVTMGATTFTGVTTSSSFSNLPAGTYTITITDANGCVTTKTRTVATSFNIPAAPLSGSDQTQCEATPIQTLTATATSVNTIRWYDAATNGTLVANPVLNTVGSVTYFAEASQGTCVSATRTPVTLTINSNPPAPTSGGNQAQCELSPLQLLTATATGSSVTWFNASAGGTLITSPTLNSVGTVTFYAQSTLNSCNSKTRTPVSLTINPVPAAPVSGGNQTQCELLPVQTLTATATGSSVTWYDAASPGNLIVSPTLNSVGSVTYYAQSTLGSCISRTRTPVSLTLNPVPSAPTSGGNQTQCEQSPIQTLTATATGVSITWYDVSSAGNLIANPTLNSVGSVTYYAQSTLGSCTSRTRTPVALTINPTPAAPVSGGNQTACELSPLQTLTATATGNSITWYNAATLGNLVASPVLNSVGSIIYYAQATLGTCNSRTRTPVTLTINGLPLAPIVCIKQPSLCGPSTGTITILSPEGQGFQYSVNNGSTWQSSTLFLNLTAGSVSGIKVKDNNGCISATVACAESNCAQQPVIPGQPGFDPSTTDAGINTERSASKISKTEQGKDLSVTAYPNPFNEKVKFLVTAPHSGNCSLEIFNVMGHKMKTIFQGFIPAGENLIEATMPDYLSGYFIYRLTMDDKQITGKLMKANLELDK